MESLIFDSHFGKRFVHKSLGLHCDSFCARQCARKSKLVVEWLISFSMSSTGSESNTALPVHPTVYGPVATRTTTEYSTPPVAPWRASQPAASSAMQIEDSSGACAYWDRATVDQQLISARSRGIGFGQGPFSTRCSACRSLATHSRKQ